MMGNSICIKIHLFYSNKCKYYLVSFGPSPAVGELGSDGPMPDSLSSDPDPLCCCCCCSLESLHKAKMCMYMLQLIFVFS